MERVKAAYRCKEELVKHGLGHWSVRWNNNPDSHFLGLCSYKDECIILSSHHVDMHTQEMVETTILHEVAHAIVGPGHGHDEVWASKAKEIGCDNTLPCSNLSLAPHVIDAIRSGADVEITFDEHVVRVPKYNITRLQDKCEQCGKVAKSASEVVIETAGDRTPNMKIITLECGHKIVKNIPKGTPFHLFQTGGDPNCQHVWDKNSCTLCDRKRPYQFQLEGMAFLEQALAVNSGGAIFDEMGLGKTIQAGGTIKFHPELWPTLWQVKSGLKYQFSHFLINWLGPDHVPQIINSSKDWLIPGLKHYIISYDMLVPKSRKLKNGTIATSGFDIGNFSHIGGKKVNGEWTGGTSIKCIVLDECQQIKNVDSSRTQMTRRVVKETGAKVIPLSGTPWNNRGSELFPVLNMMDRIKFNSEEGFKRTWVNTYWAGNVLKEGGIRNPEKFKEFTKDICIRRERAEVMKELPLVNRTKLNVVFDQTQEKVYDKAVEEFVQWYEDNIEGMTGMAIIAAMQKMRHLVALAKIPTTIEYIDEFIEDTDRKIVVFAHHKDVQMLLYDELKTSYDAPNGQRKKIDGVEVPYIPVMKLFADLNGAQRFEVQTQFNEAKRVILVASQLASGEGLNLQTCSDCIMHERQWNPGKEEQCEGRFIRIGQMATSVNAVYAHLEGLTTIDPQLDAIVGRKRIQFHDWTGTEATKWSEDSIIKELAESIVRAHRAKHSRGSI